MEEKDKLNKIIDEAKILLNIFEQIKEKADTNNQCLFLKYMDRVTIGRMIVPYLDIKDILEFRFTCKDINAAVSSTVSLVSYYKAVSKKKQAQPVPNENIFKAFNELNDGEDIQMQLESLRQIKDFLTQKLYQSESVIKLYKNDLEYLKSELRSQNEITERLTETLSQYRSEYEEAKNMNTHLKSKLDETVKTNEENSQHYTKSLEDMSKAIETLKIDKSNLTSGIIKLKKIVEDLKKKNSAKSEALKSIRNFFLTSTVFKIKSISQLDENEKK